MKHLFISLLIFSNLYTNDKIDINFKDLNLEELIKIVSDETGKKILLTTKVEGTVDFISKKPLSKDELFKVLNLSLNDKGYELKDLTLFIRL